ncbi:DUF4113 domain-containing protein [Pseudomonas coronafaciens]|uniref:DUF4113 domain-containing protein n=1 Tax=Pseudomonas coronafaciens TaxID=53409 RepID=UPI001E58F35C|nr:DUF4113 domain-containing protein [Pseudomonas coronafaciens]
MLSCDDLSEQKALKSQHCAEVVRILPNLGEQERGQPEVLDLSGKPHDHGPAVEWNPHGGRRAHRSSSRMNGWGSWETLSMRVLDRINVKFGKNALHSGRMPIDAAWAMKREMMSRSYTTSINRLMKFKAL